MADSPQRDSIIVSASAHSSGLTVRVRSPFDLVLSLSGAASFLPLQEAPHFLAVAVELDGKLVSVSISQAAQRLSSVRASAVPGIDKASLEAIAKWLVWSELNLQPFYKLVADHPVLGPVTSTLNGLKPLRPATLFEMAVITITEQQLSLAAAFHIRMRLISRFGSRLGDLMSFPPAERLAEAPLEELLSCGLSRRKAEYIKELARRTVEGLLNFSELMLQSEERIRQTLLTIRGFGEWSADYMLARGFGRPDAVPLNDVGLQRVIGHYFARGRRLTSAQLEKKLAPFKPFRGIVAYYLAVHWRLHRSVAFPAR